MKTKTYQITTEYDVGTIKQTIRDLAVGEVHQVTMQLADAQVQHALLALGWKKPSIRLPRKTKAAKAAASLTSTRTPAS